MVNIAIRLDDYMLRPKEREQFESVVSKFMKMEIPVTLSVVPNLLHEDAQSLTYLKNFSQLPNCEVAIHGFNHSGFNGQPYEFDLSYEQQKKTIMSGLEILQPFISDPVTIATPFYRSTQDTLAALSDLSHERRMNFVLSAYLKFMKEGCYWTGHTFVINRGIDVIKEWRGDARPILSPEELAEKISDDSVLVFHPAEHFNKERENCLDNLLDYLGQQRNHNLMTCKSLAEYRSAK